jgi:predicted ArsR family transcriptional regulator
LPAPTDIKLQRSNEIDLTLIRAMAHRDRYLALHILNERIASPNEVANEIGAPTSRVAYHVRELEKFGCIELIGTKPRRGATEHFYRATKRAFFVGEDWVRIPRSLRESLIGNHLAIAGRYISEALEEGTFEARPDRHHSWTRMLVDEQGWTDSMAVLLEALDKLLEIQGDSSARLEKEDEPAIPLVISLMGFEAPSSQVAAGG